MVGIAQETVRKALFKEPELTLAKAIEICQIHESADADNKTVNRDVDVNAIKTGKSQSKPRC